METEPNRTRPGLAEHTVAKQMERIVPAIIPPDNTINKLSFVCLAEIGFLCIGVFLTAGVLA